MDADHYHIHHISLSMYKSCTRVCLSHSIYNRVCSLVRNAYGCLWIFVYMLHTDSDCGWCCVQDNAVCCPRLCHLNIDHTSVFLTLLDCRLSLCRLENLSAAVLCSILVVHDTTILVVHCTSSSFL